MPPRRRLLAAAALPLGILASGALVWQASFAAFTATTSSEANTWESGTVALSLDNPGTARFTESGLVPGDFDDQCFTVTYTGDVAANVEMYVTSTPSGQTGLAPYLDMVVQVGNGVATDCSDFFPQEHPFAWAPASTLVGSHSTYATGLGTWAPSAAGQTKTYRIFWALQDTDLAQGQGVALDVTWEAQSTAP